MDYIDECDAELLVTAARDTSETLLPHQLAIVDQLRAGLLENFRDAGLPNMEQAAVAGFIVLAGVTARAERHLDAETASVVTRACDELRLSLVDLIRL